MSIPTLTPEETFFYKASELFGASLAGNGRKKRKKSTVAVIKYNKLSLFATVTVHVTKFVNSQRVGGAACEPKPEGASADSVYKLGLGYVAKSTAAPRPRVLKAQYGLPKHPHFLARND